MGGLEAKCVDAATNVYRELHVCPACKEQNSMMRREMDGARSNALKWTICLGSISGSGLLDMMRKLLGPYWKRETITAKHGESNEQADDAEKTALGLHWIERDREVKISAQA